MPPFELRGILFIEGMTRCRLILSTVRLGNKVTEIVGILNIQHNLVIDNRKHYEYLSSGVLKYFLIGFLGRILPAATWC